MLTLQKKNATLRLAEVRQTLDVIKTLESSDPLKEDSKEVLILRGLFYVHLYGAMEFSITQGVQALLNNISTLNIDFAHFQQSFHSVALDPEFTSVRDGALGRKWETRRGLLLRQVSSEKCTLNDTIFALYLQNIWYETLENIFGCLCISAPVIPKASLRGYIDEVVNKRNAVAHGRESPADVGRGTRSPDLQIKLDAITTITQYVLSCLEDHLVNRKFLAPAHRVRYKA